MVLILGLTILGLFFNHFSIYIYIYIYILFIYLFIYLFFLIGKKQYIDQKIAQGSQKSTLEVYKKGDKKKTLQLTYTPTKSKSPPKNLSYQHYTT